MPVNNFQVTTACMLHGCKASCCTLLYTMQQTWCESNQRNSCCNCQMNSALQQRTSIGLICMFVRLPDWLPDSPVALAKTNSSSSLYAIPSSKSCASKKNKQPNEAACATKASMRFQESMLTAAASAQVLAQKLAQRSSAAKHSRTQGTAVVRTTCTQLRQSTAANAIPAATHT